MSRSDRMFCYGMIFGIVLSIITIQLGREAAPPAPSILSPVPSEIHPD